MQKIYEKRKDQEEELDRFVCGKCLGANILNPVNPMYQSIDGFHYRLYNFYYCPRCKEIRRRDKKEVYRRSIAQEILKQ